MKNRICTALLALTMTAFAMPALAADTETLQIEFAFEARVTVDKPLVVGESSHGLRRIVPISGGTVKGPALTGRVVPGGADWQFVRPDGVLEVLAKYTLQAEDGTLVLVENRGLRHASPAVMERITKGEAVAPTEYYFRTSAQFEAPKGSKYEWMNRSVFIGVAERHPDAAVIKFYRVK